MFFLIFHGKSFSVNVNLICGYDERNQIGQAKKLKYPKLQFNFDETFTNNMLNNFSWGGDWWTQKDYMHFQKK